MLGADHGVRRGRDARKRLRGAESNRTMHAQRGKILPRGGAAVEELRREERETRGRGARERGKGSMQSRFSFRDLNFVIEIEI